MGYAHKLQNVMWSILFSFGFSWFVNQLCRVFKWLFISNQFVHRFSGYSSLKDWIFYELYIFRHFEYIKIRLGCVDVFWWSTHKFSLHTSLGKWKIEITWKPKRFRDMHNYVYTCAYLSMRHKIQQWCIIEQST